MQYIGLLIQESLKDEAFLNFANVTKRAPHALEEATDEQVKNVTFIHFTVTNDFAPAVVEEISKALKPRGWFGEVENEYEKFVIFPNRIFKYSKNDSVSKQKAIEYGKSLGIPEIQLVKI